MYSWAGWKEQFSCLVYERPSLRETHFSRKISLCLGKRLGYFFWCISGLMKKLWDLTHFLKVLARVSSFKKQTFICLMLLYKQLHTWRMYVNYKAYKTYNRPPNSNAIRIMWMAGKICTLCAVGAQPFTVYTPDKQKDLGTEHEELSYSQLDLPG